MGKPSLTELVKSGGSYFVIRISAIVTLSITDY